MTDNFDGSIYRAFDTVNARWFSVSDKGWGISYTHPLLKRQQPDRGLVYVGNTVCRFVYIDDIAGKTRRIPLGETRGAYISGANMCRMGSGGGYGNYSFYRETI